MHVKDIPLTYEGKAIHNIKNCLPAVLATYLFRDITIEDIRSALTSFVPSSTQTPGRLNFFNFKNFTFLADFAHNPHGLKLLCDFVSKLGLSIRLVSFAVPVTGGMKISGNWEKFPPIILMRSLSAVIKTFVEELLMKSLVY